MQLALQKLNSYSFARWMILVSLFFHLWAAWLSVGFQFEDEQNGVLEWASYKVGLTSEASLESHISEQARPWLVPAIFTVLFESLKAMGIENPFTWVTVGRFLSALLGLLSVALLVQCCKKWFVEHLWRRWAMFGAALIWYLPYLHARTSTDNWAGSFFAIGLALLVNAVFDRVSPQQGLSVRRTLLAGFFMGLAFECRFPVSVMIGAIFLWAAGMAKVGGRALISLALGVAVAFFVGRGIDYWGYGVWSWAPWNALKINFFGGGAGQAFSQQPLSAYFTWFLNKGIPFLNIFLLIGVLFAWWLKPKLSLTWATLFFVFFHTLLPQKEFRFLYPIAPLVPILAAFGYRGWRQKQKSNFPRAKSFLMLVGSHPLFTGFILILNWVCLLAASSFPARYELTLLRYLYDQKILRVYYQGQSPYDLGGHTTGLYRLPQAEAIPVVGPSTNLESDFWLFTPVENPTHLDFANHSCRRVFRAVPRILDRPRLSAFVRSVTRNDWSLYRCEPAERPS